MATVAAAVDAPAVQEGEIDIDMAALESDDAAAVDASGSVAAGTAASSADPADSDDAGIRPVAEWHAYDTTLVDLFQQAADSYTDAQPAQKKPRTTATTPRRHEEEMKRAYENYPPSEPRAPAAQPARLTHPPAVFVQSRSHHPSAAQQQQAAAAGAYPSARPLATNERNVGSPSGNKQIAALIKQQQAARRQGGQAAAGAGPASPPPAASTAAVAATASPVPPAAASAHAHASLPQWSPPPHGFPPMPPSMPTMPGPPNLGSGGGMPMPMMPPPGMPPPTHEAMMEDAALTNLLLSWYYAGYYTGKHQAMKAMQQQQQHAQPAAHQPAPPPQSAPSGRGPLLPTPAGADGLIAAQHAGTKRKAQQ